ncbi:MAG TPA: hypothetical protein VMD31_14825, partial [Opitutaceae bacterium]|nr:hypothetical protein [Opitutaceae bacterium]
LAREQAGAHDQREGQQQDAEQQEDEDVSHGESNIRDSMRINPKRRILFSPRIARMGTDRVGRDGSARRCSDYEWRGT